MVRCRTLGSAALHLAYVAMGAVDAYWTLRVHCWDIAAGIIIIKEAGGVILDPSGNIISDGSFWWRIVL